MASTCLIASTVQAQVKSATAEEEATAKALVGFIRAKTDMTPFNVPRHLRGTVAMWDIGETHVMRGIISGRGDLKDDAVCSDAEIVE